MSESAELLRYQSLQARCRHPKGERAEFARGDLTGSIPARFEKMASQYPERRAVKATDAELTYRELEAAASRLAQPVLQQCGPDALSRRHAELSMSRPSRSPESTIRPARPDGPRGSCVRIGICCTTCSPTATRFRSHRTIARAGRTPCTGCRLKINPRDVRNVRLRWNSRVRANSG